MKHIKKEVYPEGTNTKASKELFLKYLKKYGGGYVQPFDFGNEIVLSFEGSDGPAITDKGIENVGAWSNVEAIDMYINDGCDDHQCGQSCPRPIKSFEEFLKTI